MMPLAVIRALAVVALCVPLQPATSGPTTSRAVLVPVITIERAEPTVQRATIARPPRPQMAARSSRPGAPADEDAAHSPARGRADALLLRLARSREVQMRRD